MQTGSPSPAAPNRPEIRRRIGTALSRVREYLLGPATRSSEPSVSGRERSLANLRPFKPGPDPRRNTTRAGPGRPPARYRERLKDMEPAALAKLEALMGSQNSGVALKAVIEILSRLHGRPVEPLEISEAKPSLRIIIQGGADVEDLSDAAAPGPPGDGGEEGDAQAFSPPLVAVASPDGDDEP
jgi:hypothetical protein